MEKAANDCDFQSCETVNRTRTRRTLPAVSVASAALTPRQLEPAEVVPMILGKGEKTVRKGSEVRPKALTIRTCTSIRSKTTFTFQQCVGRFLQLKTQGH